MADKKQDNPYGYDVVNEVKFGGGRYLSFKKGDKGKVIQIRLASEPKYAIQHWILQSTGKQLPVVCGKEACSYCGKDVPAEERLDKTALWGWIVIDREDGQAKVFTGPTLIARKVKEFSELKDKKTGKPIWGNPLLYDLMIERTEEPGAAYYSVTPVPEGKGKDITAKEKELVKKADFDLAKELKGGKKSDRTGNYDLETAPEGAEEGQEGSGKDLPF